METPTIKDSETSRHLTQEELDSINRHRFIEQILEALTAGRKVRFIVHRNFYSLVEFRRVRLGEYEMDIADQHKYTYRLSHLVDLIERIYDENLEVISLNGEVQLDCRHVQANA